MEKEKAVLAVSIQKEKQELSQLASIKAEIESIEQIPIGKKFLSEHGLLDYFKKALIHSNNRDL